MSQSRIFPFRRVSVDHMVRGNTRVWWQLEPTFNQPGPYVFQLQLGKTGLRDAVDWTNIGAPVTDSYLAYDPSWHTSGYELLSHYRVTLTTPSDLYVSQAASCFGELPEKDWVLSREVIRKEKLRHRYVSTPGYLLKPMRFGQPCRRCLDPLTQEITDSNCAVCKGTGFETGYHPPLEMQCWDLSPQTNQTQIDDQAKGTTRDNPYVTARVIGFPALSKNDIWVNGASDERWLVESIQTAAAIRNVPLVYTVQLGLLPFNNTAYGLEVYGEANPPPVYALPIEGCGAITVDHNYGAPDALAYTDGTDCAVEGAYVYVFTKAVYDAAYPAMPDRTDAVAVTTTSANGRWTTAVQLDEGDYALLFEKPGDYGPDIQIITVVAAGATLRCVWLSEQQLQGTSDDPTTPVVNEEELIITEDNVDVVTDGTEKICGPVDPADDFWNI